MKRLQIAGLCFAAAATASAQILDCNQGVVYSAHFRRIQVRSMGIKDCATATRYAQLAMESQNIQGMTCEAATTRNRMFEKNCKGGDMYLHIVYVNK